jgi:hypothetical protein
MRRVPLTWRVNVVFDYANGGGRSQTARVAAEVAG